MSQALIKRARWIPLLLLAAIACDDETVFVDVPVPSPPDTVEVPRSLYKEPLPEGAANFLGYNDDELSNPTCAECHAEIGGSWKGTAHADAWAGLQGSGHAQEFCEGCHTISELGNAATEPGGWTGSQDERYVDVQCESCHGPGKDHVDSGTNGPLASIAVPFTIVDGEVLSGDNGCGECHSGAHHPFVEQWALSGHAAAAELSGAEDPTRYCVGCHAGQGAILAWGSTSNYVEKEWAEGEAQPITCAVCHNPHDATYEGQLRWPVENTTCELHLCAQCHDRRSVPDAGSHGLHPHSPETAMLAGEAGYFFPNMPIDPGAIITTHGSSANPRLCAGCHVSMYTVEDEGGNFVLEAVGHTFQPIPCVDEQGIPIADTECELSTTARSFNGCVASGCHGAAEAALGALTAASTRTELLVEELEDVLLQVDPNLDEPCVVPDVPGDPIPNTCLIDATDGVITTAEGAFFNMELAIHPSGTRVWGSATHNPFLLETLLIVSLQNVEDEYGVLPGGGAPARVMLDTRLEEVLRKAGMQ